MQNQLIPVFVGEIGAVQQHVVDGRTLHTHLESRRKFSDWISERIDQYDFQENVDYGVFHNFVKNSPKGGRPQQDYHLTLDMAKELAMVERTSKGKEARQYFIQVEKEYLSGRQAHHPSLDKIPLRREIRDIVDKLVECTNLQQRNVLVGQAAQFAMELGEPSEMIEQIEEMRTPTPMVQIEHPVVQEFWSIYTMLHELEVKDPETGESRKRELLNHSNSYGEIAINLKHFCQFCKDHQMPTPPQADLRKYLPTSQGRKFLLRKTVRSRITGRPIHCMVFRGES